MAYTRNFGFRSFENLIRDGRNQVPATGSPYLIGTAVVVDSTNTLVRPSDSANPTVLSGVVVFEHIQYQGTDPFLASPNDFPYTVVPLGRFAQMVHGRGAKVYFKNTADQPLYDGRVIAGQTIVAGLGGATPTIVVGDYLTPAADGTWKEGNATNGWFQVEQVNNASGLCEARFTF
jgi:hypothetical protein